MISRIVSVAFAVLAASAPQPNYLLCPCGMSETELADQLHEMSGLAADFLDAEAETGVNAVLLASIAALESGWGTSWAAETRNNLFGIMAADGSLRRFESKRECIMYSAQLLADEYLSEDGSYYEGGTLESVAGIYCESDGWAEKVQEIMVMIGGEQYAAVS